MGFKLRALCGPLAAILFGAGIVVLSGLVPGYDQVRQTVSEIGEMTSPMRWPFAYLLFAVSALVVVFATAIASASGAIGRSRIAAWFTGVMAISASGIAWFAFPHPLHNVFGISELVAYQAPLVLALSWRGEPRMRAIVRWSSIMCALVWVAIALNLVTFDRGGAVWAMEKPFYGLVQRFLFATWFVWSAGVGILLYRRASSLQQTGQDAPNALA